MQACLLPETKGDGHPSYHERATRTTHVSEDVWHVPVYDQSIAWKGAVRLQRYCRVKDSYKERKV